MTEEWKPIKGLHYEVSSFGNIRNSESHKLISQFDKNGEGYIRVNLFSNGKKKRYFIHRLVAETFIPNPENKPQVNHKDGNKQNNELSNLEWVTCSENGLHYYHVILGLPVKEKVYKAGSFSIKAKKIKRTSSNKYRKKVYPDYNGKGKQPEEIHIKAWETRHKVLSERNKIILDLLEKGKTKREVAKIFNLSLRQIYDIIGGK